MTQCTDDHEQEKITQEQDAQVKAKRRKECIRKREQAMKAAQSDPRKAQPPQAQRTDAEVPSIAMVDKAFESRAAGGLPSPLTRASLVTPRGTLVVRKGNIPPPSSLPKAQQTILPCHRVRAPTPFNGKEIVGYTDVGSNKHAHEEEEDFCSPLFTQKKCVCSVVLSNDNNLLAGETITQDMKSAAGNGVGEMAESECKASHDLGKQTNVQPKVRDYPKELCQVIGTAIELYHTLLLNENPFPDPNEELKWVRKVFDASCTYHKLPNVKLDTGKIKIITARGSHLRGQFKATKKKNQKLATELKTKLVFAFRFDVQELHPSPYQHLQEQCDPTYHQ
ncbi:hypothetical protein OG21DRAFT_1492100 [Imleria badia]|nr:hypothetical protein OG21DRAFT_1492100 [Imleria badia]